MLILLLGCTRPLPPLDGPWDAVDADTAATLQSALEAARAEQGMPGLAMAVAFREEHTLWVGTDGLADVEAGRAWVPDDTFRIGSVTKTFTTAAVFQLVEEGVLGLDDPIEAWVPGFYAGPTLRHLLGHSSGIPSYNYIGDFDASQPWTPTALVQWAVDHESALHFEPGTQFEYSNTNYILLGLAIEAATGQSYEDVVNERFLAPLHLDATVLAHSGDPAPTVRSYDADGVDVTGDADPSMGWAAGGLVSTPADLALWQLALHESVLSAESWEAMTTPGGLTGPEESEYGLGAFHEGDGTLDIYGHTGGIAGYATFAYILDDPRVALVVMSNEQPTDLRAASIWAWSAILDL